MKITYALYKVRPLIDIVLKDPGRKSIFRMFVEFSKYLITDRTIADQYFPKLFYRKNSENHHHYLVTLDVLFNTWTLNNTIYTRLLDDKLLFEQFFSKHNPGVVTSLAYNSNAFFFHNNKILQIGSTREFSEFLTLLIESNNLNSLFLKKSANSYGGLNTFKLTIEDIKMNPAVIETIYKEVVKTGYLYQKVIKQHEMLNTLNPHCVNTIRIDTFSNRLNKVNVLSSFIRVGINKSHIDNIANGGVFIGIDINTGTLFADAQSDISHGKCKSFKTHPNTGVKFDGFRIPYYEEAKQLVIEMAQLVPNLKLIGWDVIIQPNGPVILEGNARPGIEASELVQKGFHNNPVFKEMMDELYSKA